jgi:hypothetical protein
MAKGAGRHGGLVELAAGLIGRDDGVGVLVWIDAEQHHGGGLLGRLGISGRPAGMPARRGCC